MPKPIRELEASQRPLGERVLQFLGKDSENGYTLNEIIAGVEGGDDRTTTALVLLFLQLSRSQDEALRMRSPYEDALKTLVDRKQVRLYPVGEVMYYAAAQAS